MWMEFVYGEGTSVDYAKIALEYFYLNYKKFLLEVLLACVKVIVSECPVMRSFLLLL